MSEYVAGFLVLLLVRCGISGGFARRSFGLLLEAMASTRASALGELVEFRKKILECQDLRAVKKSELMSLGIPYLKTIQGRRGERDQKPMSKAEYAQAGRDALQQYLVALIRAVVSGFPLHLHHTQHSERDFIADFWQIFRPESNRLCKFFELSSLTLTLAPRGGFQGKAGFLKIPGSNASRRANQPGLTPTSWIHNRSPKWFIVRDSYFVATDGPEAVSGRFPFPRGGAWGGCSTADKG